MNSLFYSLCSCFASLHTTSSCEKECVCELIEPVCRLPDVVYIVKCNRNMVHACIVIDYFGLTSLGLSFGFAELLS